MHPDAVKEIIEQALPDAEVSVSGDGRHFEALVVSDAFVGKSMLAQHRMVYTALGERFQNDTVHALSLKTYTREEWEKARG